MWVWVCVCVCVGVYRGKHWWPSDYIGRESCMCMCNNVSQKCKVFPRPPTCSPPVRPVRPDQAGPAGGQALVSLSPRLQNRFLGSADSARSCDICVYHSDTHPVMNSASGAVASAMAGCMNFVRPGTCSCFGAEVAYVYRSWQI